MRQLVEDRKQLIQLLRHLYSKYGVSSGRANRRMGTRLYPRRTNGKQEAQLSKRRARRAAIAKQLDEKRQDTNHNEKPHETHEDVEQQDAEQQDEGHQDSKQENVLSETDILSVISMITDARKNTDPTTPS